jgi:glycyl-tRNA synthetase
VQYDEAGAIGRRYRRQDAIGTPVCVTIDDDSIDQETVTLRMRDSMEQITIPLKDLPDTLSTHLTSEAPWQLQKKS